MIFATKYSFLRNITFFRFKEHLVHPFCFFFVSGFVWQETGQIHQIEAQMEKTIHQFRIHFHGFSVA